MKIKFVNTFLQNLLKKVKITSRWEGYEVLEQTDLVSDNTAPCVSISEVSVVLRRESLLENVSKQ